LIFLDQLKGFNESFAAFCSPNQTGMQGTGKSGFQSKLSFIDQLKRSDARILSLPPGPEDGGSKEIISLYGGD